MGLSVSGALAQRISTRAFLDKPVSENLIREILDAARRAPSGGNLQPWKVIAAGGDELPALTALAQRVLSENPTGEDTDRPVYPSKLWEPYRTRRFEAGEELYGRLEIPREDKGARLTQFWKNYEFFGAPAALFFVIEEEMGHGQWAHLGMFMQSIALLLEERGLASCMQEAWGILRPSLKSHFGLADGEMIYCGMAVGYADPDAVINRVRTAREPVDAFTEVRGF